MNKVNIFNNDIVKIAGIFFTAWFLGFIFGIGIAYFIKNTIIW